MSVSAQDLKVTICPALESTWFKRNFSQTIYT